MIIEETCPECGAVLDHMVLAVYPPIYKVICPKCGFSHAKQAEIERIPYKSNAITLPNNIIGNCDMFVNNKPIVSLISDVMDEYFAIPCDLCHKYISHADGCCPQSFPKCNSHEHWKVLIEAILGNYAK